MTALLRRMANYASFTLLLASAALAQTSSLEGDVRDEKGEPIAVLIDLKKNPEIWEDFHDLMILEKRRNEPSIPAEEVYAKLEKKRKVAVER